MTGEDGSEKEPYDQDDASKLGDMIVTTSCGPM